jgi:hypothetical protein
LFEVQAEAAFIPVYHRKRGSTISRPEMIAVWWLYFYYFCPKFGQ